jgi:hypothetical protein
MPEYDPIIHGWSRKSSVIALEELCAVVNVAVKQIRKIGMCSFSLDQVTYSPPNPVSSTPTNHQNQILSHHIFAIRELCGKLATFDLSLRARRGRVCYVMFVPNRIFFIPSLCLLID